MIQETNKPNTLIAINDLKSHCLSRIDEQEQKLIMGGKQPVIACAKTDDGQGICIKPGGETIIDTWDFDSAYGEKFILFDDKTSRVNGSDRVVRAPLPR